MYIHTYLHTYTYTYIHKYVYIYIYISLCESLVGASRPRAPRRHVLRLPSGAARLAPLQGAGLLLLSLLRL